MLKGQTLVARRDDAAALEDRERVVDGLLDVFAGAPLDAVDPHEDAALDKVHDVGGKGLLNGDEADGREPLLVRVVGV